MRGGEGGGRQLPWYIYVQVESSTDECSKWRNIPKLASTNKHFPSAAIATIQLRSQSTVCNVSFFRDFLHLISAMTQSVNE